LFIVVADTPEAARRQSSENEETLRESITRESTHHESTAYNWFDEFGKSRFYNP
jgi:hypothetical protein